MYRTALTALIWIALILAPSLARATDEGLAPGALDFTQRVVEETELEHLSLTRLTLLREGMYARHGQTEFDAPWIAAYFKAQPWYHAVGPLEQKDLSGLERRNLFLIADRLNTMELYQIYDLRTAIYKHYQPGQDLSEADAREVELSWQVQRRLEQRGHVHPTDEPLSLSNLRHMSRGDLAALRNAIFARRGRAFTDRTVTAFFYRSYGYRPNPVWTDDMLTPLDWQNINLVLQVEREKGGPLQSLSWAVADGG